MVEIFALSVNGNLLQRAMYYLNGTSQIKYLAKATTAYVTVPQILSELGGSSHSTDSLGDQLQALAEC